MAELDLAGTVVTVDALHTQRATADHLVSTKDADYIMTIKANQPGLLTAAQHALSGPAADFVEYTEQARGHGRTQERILRTTPVTTQVSINFPHAAQVFRVIRYVGDLDGQRHSKEVTHCVTSLAPDKANAPDLGKLLRDHWGAIENKLHRAGPQRMSATPPSTKTPPPSAPAPPHRRCQSSATPSSPRSDSPDGTTSNKPAATSPTSSTGAPT